MQQHEFKATLLVYDDGTLALTESTLVGLVLETTSFAKMKAELNRIVPRLLVSNHGFEPGDAAELTIRVEHGRDEDGRSARSTQPNHVRHMELHLEVYA